MAKKKWYKRIRWNVLGPILVCLVLFIYLVISLLVSIFSDKHNYDIQTICSYTGKQTYAVVTNENRENPIEIKDYNFFGESLNLYFEKYDIDIDASATMANKQIALVNLCNDSEVLFDVPALDDEGRLAILDQGIQLNQLEDGFYSIYQKYNDKYSRFYFSYSLDTVTFYTVAIEGKCKKVELIARSDYFDPSDKKEDDASTLDNNYLYLQVSTVEATDVEQYDIVISTSPALTSSGVSLVGEEIGAFVEAEEVFDIANTVAQALSEKGLRVLVAKNTADEDIQYYGVGGVLDRSYSCNAKYFIHLDLVYNDSVGVFYSYRSSDAFAQAIFDELLENTTLFENTRQLDYCDLVSGANEDNEDKYYDGIYEIREAGGSALAAGQYSETAQKNTFASNDKTCMNPIEIVLYDMIDGSTNFYENKDNAATAIINGIENYLNIK